MDPNPDYDASDEIRHQLVSPGSCAASYPPGCLSPCLSLNPRTDLVLVGVGMRKVPSELG